MSTPMSRKAKLRIASLEPRVAKHYNDWEDQGHRSATHCGICGRETVHPGGIVIDYQPPLICHTCEWTAFNLGHTSRLSQDMRSLGASTKNVGDSINPYREFTEVARILYHVKKQVHARGEIERASRLAKESVRENPRRS